MFDTPFNVIVYTDTLIRDQQAKSLLDVVANDPSVRSIGSLSDAYGSSVLIRGFLLQPAITVSMACSESSISGGPSCSTPSASRS